MTTLKKDLKRILDSFEGQVNDQKHREDLEAQLNKVLFTALGTDVLSFKCTGYHTEVFVDIYYKGKKVSSRSDYLAEIAEHDTFLVKGTYLDNLAELHNKYRNSEETDDEFRQRIFKELREESQVSKEVTL